EARKQGMEISNEPVRDTVRRPLHPRAALSSTKADSKTASHTKIQTAPKAFPPRSEIDGYSGRPRKLFRMSEMSPSMAPNA
ncbi:MAG: hypothetical protein O9256_02075, partial [Rhizobiaceae bacterium]|nr:hypothetical protein [Rhizobiaceae bacterium]